MKRALLFLGLPLLLVAAGCTKVGAPEVVPDYQSYNQQAAQVHLTQSVQGMKQGEAVTIASGKTALDALKQSYQVETQTFSGVGDFVNSISGVKPDTKHFWAFYVNGTSSTVGAGTYTVKEGDKLEWKLDEIK